MLVWRREDPLYRLRAPVEFGRESKRGVYWLEITRRHVMGGKGLVQSVSAWDKPGRSSKCLLGHPCSEMDFDGPSSGGGIIIRRLKTLKIEVWEKVETSGKNGDT
jgi:hypothetical protein